MVEGSQYRPQTIETAVKDMITYFGRKPIPNIITMYVEALSIYPQKIARKGIFHFINNGEKLPRIADIKFYIMNTFPETAQPKAYDREDDPDFPMYLLEKGVEVLRWNKGDKHAFEEFANRCNMPLADRARCLAKYHHAFEVDTVADTIGTHQADSKPREETTHADG